MRQERVATAEKLSHVSPGRRMRRMRRVCTCTLVHWYTVSEESAKEWQRPYREVGPRELRVAVVAVQLQALVVRNGAGVGPVVSACEATHGAIHRHRHELIQHRHGVWNVHHLAAGPGKTSTKSSASTSSQRHWMLFNSMSGGLAKSRWMHRARWNISMIATSLDDT